MHSHPDQVLYIYRIFFARRGNWFGGAGGEEIKSGGYPGITLLYKYLKFTAFLYIYKYLVLQSNFIITNTVYSDYSAYNGQQG